MSLINASHPNPILFQPASGKVTSISQKSCPQPGFIEDLSQIVPISLRLAPGDWILWHTDGLFERRSSDQKRLNRREFWKRLEELMKDPSLSSSIFCDSILGTVVSFLGTSTTDRPDDVTVVAIKAGPEAFASARSA